MLDILTFTGVDGVTSLDDLMGIGHTYTKVEFGVLMGSETDGFDHGIFPSIEVINALRNLGEQENFQTSLHLCGSFARQIMTPRAYIGFLLDICKGFNRVQVNLHGDFWNHSDIEVNKVALVEFAESVECESVILQHRGSWNSIPIIHPKVEYLFDKSGGAGIEGFNQWPDPIDSLPRIGYAGGIGLHNISKAMEIINHYPDKKIWLDMESRVRTHGRFDISIIKQICQIAFQEQG